MIKEKKNKVVIKGYVPVGIVRDVDFYYSKTQEKFVDSVEKLYLGDLFAFKEGIDPQKISGDFPMLDMFKGIAKIKIVIKL